MTSPYPQAPHPIHQLVQVVYLQDIYLTPTWFPLVLSQLAFSLAPSPASNYSTPIASLFKIRIRSLPSPLYSSHPTPTPPCLLWTVPRSPCRPLSLFQALQEAAQTELRSPQSALAGGTKDKGWVTVHAKEKNAAGQAAREGWFCGRPGAPLRKVLFSRDQVAVRPMEVREWAPWRYKQEKSIPSRGNRSAKPWEGARVVSGVRHGEWQRVRWRTQQRTRPLLPPAGGPEVFPCCSLTCPHRPCSGKSEPIHHFPQEAPLWAPFLMSKG